MSQTITPAIRHRSEATSTQINHPSHALSECCVPPHFRARERGEIVELYRSAARLSEKLEQTLSRNLHRPTEMIVRQIREPLQELQKALASVAERGAATTASLQRTSDLNEEHASSENARLLLDCCAQIIALNGGTSKNDWEETWESLAKSRPFSSPESAFETALCNKLRQLKTSLLTFTAEHRSHQLSDDVWTCS